jgi:hypothetical protein
MRFPGVEDVAWGTISSPNPMRFGLRGGKVSYPHGIKDDPLSSE